MPEKFAVIYLKFKQRGQTIGYFVKNANGIANCEDPDQTAPRGAVRSGSALFAQTYLSENLGSLWYLGRKKTAPFSQLQETGILMTRLINFYCLCLVITLMQYTCISLVKVLHLFSLETKE